MVQMGRMVYQRGERHACYVSGAQVRILINLVSSSTSTLATIVDEEKGPVLRTVNRTMC